MNLFSPVMSSRFEAEHSIRQRNIAKSSNRIASGSRLKSEPSKDSAAYRISKRLEAESKFSRSSNDNLKNAYILAQQQSDLITYAESVMKRMNTLAYNATDLTSDSFRRESLNNEFQEHSKTLESLIFDRTFQRQLLDPQAADFVDKTIIFEDQVSASGANTKKIDISALGAKIGLWWNTQDPGNTETAYN